MVESSSFFISNEDKHGSMVIMLANAKCQYYGYCTLPNGVKWLYSVTTVDEEQYTGFTGIRHLSRS